MMAVHKNGEATEDDDGKEEKGRKRGKVKTHWRTMAEKEFCHSDGEELAFGNEIFESTFVRCRRTTRRRSDYETCCTNRRRSYSDAYRYLITETVHKQTLTQTDYVHKHSSTDDDELYSKCSIQEPPTIRDVPVDADDEDDDDIDAELRFTNIKRKLHMLNKRWRGRRFNKGALLHGLMRAPRRSLDKALRIKARIQRIRNRTSTWLQRLALLSISIIAVLFLAFRACRSLNIFPSLSDTNNNRTLDSIIESLFGQSTSNSHDSSIAIARSVLLKFIAIALLAFLFTGTFVCERLFACQITLEQQEELTKNISHNTQFPDLQREYELESSDIEEDDEYFWTDYEIIRPCSCGCQNVKDEVGHTTIVTSSLKINFLYLLPLRTISRFWGQMNEVELPRNLRRPIYEWYSQTFGCNLDEIDPTKELEDYRNLSEFFRRLLAPGVRPIGNSMIVSPADGRVVQLEELGADGYIGSVKGVHYSITNFLGPRAVPQKLRAGNKLYGAVIYLAPGDYHRFHSPADWNVKYRRHFSGKLFSVKPSFVKNFPDLFSVQERVAYFGQWQHGFFSMTAVGATNVGTVNVYFDQDLRTNQFINSINYRTEKLFEDDIKFSRGDLFGEFNLGSTIVLVFEAPANQTTIDCNLLENKIKYGENLLNIFESVQ